MEEKEEKSLGPKDLARLYRLQVEIQNQVSKAIRNGDKSVTIRIGDNKGISISIAKLLETDNPDDPNQEKGYYKAESKNKSVVAYASTTKNKEDKTYKKAKVKVDVDFDIQTVNEYVDIKRREELKTQKRIKKNEISPKDNSDVQEKYLKEMLEKDKAVEMDIDREFSESENLHMFLNRAFREDAVKCYRIQKDNHTFEYMVKTRSGEYKQIALSNRPEGRNSLQKIWIMDDGELKEKTVDSLLIKGQYGIATDFPDSVVSKNTTTYLLVRLPNGQYLGTETGERYGVNRNPSGNKTQKHDFARAKSKYQLEDIVRAADTAKMSDVLNADKKLSAEEVEIVKRLQKDKGLNDKQVIQTIETVSVLKDAGFDRSEIRKILEQPEDKNKLLKREDDIKKGDSKEDIKDKIPGDYNGERTHEKFNPRF